MFRLPFSFIITGIISFILFQLFNLVDLAGWIAEHPRSPEGWFRVHLLVLGWATMIAMGAVYQLINVVLQSKIYSERLGFVHYGFFTAGVTGLLIGFYAADFLVIAVFATVAFIGIVLFAWNMLATLLRAAQWNAITICAGSAVLYLLLTGLTGMAMGLNFRYGWWSGIHERIFHAHIWLGAIGWFGLLIIGFSFKMLPMFYLSHGYPLKIQKLIAAVWNAAVVLGALAFLLEWGAIWKWLVLFLLTSSVFAYNLHIQQIRKAKHKPNPGEGIRWSVLAARALLAAGVALLILTAIVPDILTAIRTYALLGWLYLWGFVALTILAYLSKIVPFLWWTHKYGPQVGKKKIPTMSDLIDDRYVRTGMAAIAAALVVVMAGIGADIPMLSAAGGITLSLFSLAYIGLVAKVFIK